MKLSELPVANSAGMKHSLTWLMGVRSLMSKLALLLMLDLMSFIAALTKKEGILVWDLANSPTSYFISAKGLSNTIPPIEGSRSPCKSDVTAPIERPQSPIVEQFLSFLRCSTIMWRSSLSHHPSDMYSPSDSPQPAKSKQKSVMFDGRRYGTASMASSLDELLP